MNAEPFWGGGKLDTRWTQVLLLGRQERSAAFGSASLPVLDVPPLRAHPDSERTVL